MEKDKKSKQLVIDLEILYRSNLKKDISNAAAGWFFADSFDRHFMAEQPSKIVDNKNGLKSKNNSPINNQDAPDHQIVELEPNDRRSLENLFKYLRKSKYSKTLNRVNKQQNLARKIEILNNSLVSDSSLFHDDFKGIDLKDTIRKTFSEDKLNFVIIGGGICGLFLASTIKFVFGNGANVLVVDNRSSKPNTREPFNRKWLTHLPLHLFQTNKPSNVQSLIESFRSNNLVGLPINMLETIFQLSCKDQGVKFYFAETPDFSSISDSKTDLVFDATGGRLDGCSYSVDYSREVPIKVTKRSINLEYAGVNQRFNSPTVGKDHINFVLKPSGCFHYPHIRNLKVNVHMVKITGVPMGLMSSLLEFVSKFNYSNQFYIWNGILNEEINEGLVLINIRKSEEEFLNSVISGSTPLQTLLNNNPISSEHLNENIISTLNMLSKLDTNNSIKIEKPFRYRPYINLGADSGSLNGKSLFPVGDSLFCGHPKMGNGLSYHLNFINKLVEKLAAR